MVVDRHMLEDIYLSGRHQNIHCPRTALYAASIIIERVDQSSTLTRRPFNWLSEFYIFFFLENGSQLCPTQELNLERILKYARLNIHHTLQCNTIVS